MLNGVLSVLEPYEVKVSSTVLRGERDSNVPHLPDIKQVILPLFARQLTRTRKAEEKRKPS